MDAQKTSENWLDYYEQKEHLAILLSYFPRDEELRKEIAETEEFLDNFIEEKLHEGNGNKASL